MQGLTTTFFSATKTAFRLVLPVLRARLILVIGLQMIAYFAAQYFRLAEKQMASFMEENLLFIATNAGLSIAFDLVWQAVFFMVTILTVLDLTSPRKVGLRRTSESFQELVIENIRVAARAIFWLPFFIVPALYKYVRLSMVSFIVLTDEEYAKGEADALKKSYEVTKGRVMLCTIALILSSMIEPLVSNIITGGEIWIFENPIGSVLSIPASLIVELWAMIFLFAIYSQLRSNPSRPN